ncbi:PREDICTED: uncharacterized protein LOC105559676 isoform X2 [Vollenhovia emeryi]|uniref:uncharacterized protein LOC105559676 isoform X2 n=1 Tax=Vollenhovia emeryi TaxID=411798 RepID=UPI0005F4A830|nr:PREDICTED: uncharacterized protein LOC105559676 isoform X2 [Vollenhovia emeryi]
MICIETQYLGLNRILLLAIGLWPFQQSKFTRFQFIFLFALLMTFTIFQLTPFRTTLKYTSDFVITIVSSVSFSILCMTKYCGFYVNFEPVKKLFIQLQHICNELKDKNEIAIIEKYGYTAKCYTIALIAGTCGIPIIIQFWTTSDDIPSMNLTRPGHMQVITEYFVDGEKYFFLIQLHVTIAVCIGGIVLLATGTLFIAYFIFFCGMLKIASYRVERAVNINISLKNKIVRSEDLICAVDIHRQALQFATYFMSKFEVMFFFVAQSLIISICFNFVRISQVVMSEQAIQLAFVPSVFAAINILYLFIANLLGQNMTDHNNYVFDTVYGVEWYATPLHIQRLILFLLLNGVKKFTINVGGLFVPSFECFATVMKTSVSYFTVILTTQSNTNAVSA